MGPRQLLDELIEAAGLLGIEVKSSPFATPTRHPGGLCKLRGKWLVVLDRGASISERTYALAEALGEFEMDGITVAPEALRVIKGSRSYRRRVHEPAPSPASAAGPGVVSCPPKPRKRSSR